jgi:HK97 family phage prohead protease
VIEKTAFDETIRAWQTSGKSLPLLAEHSTTVVGSIDPHSMYASDDGLVVAGQVDLDTAEGQQAWKMIKRGTAGFSIGFMSESKARRGGGRTITEIDLLEVSITATPVHQSTRALSWKSQPPIRIASFEC